MVSYFEGSTAPTVPPVGVVDDVVEISSVVSGSGKQPVKDRRPRQEARRSAESEVFMVGTLVRGTMAPMSKGQTTGLDAGNRALVASELVAPPRTTTAVSLSLAPTPSPSKI
jgi:hypothetical protein